MSVPFLTPSRCVLLVGDDAVHIFDVRSSKTKRLKTIPWGDENFIDDVTATIEKHCSGRSIVILHDMVEQHYRKEKVPNIGAFDKANIVQRRLSVAFPAYPIKAALPLKEKANQADGGNQSNNVYLFAALSKSNYFSKIVAVLKKSLLDISAFCLLPIESASLVSKMSEKIFPAPSGAKRSRWTVFIGQHYGGGLRQIVTRNGELALTRLTPIVDTDSQPELWAAEVAQEFKATMSYLSRFGYSQEEGLNVILISNPKAGEIVGEIIDTPCSFKNITAIQAGALLGLSIGIQEDMRYADPLHVAWSGQKTKHTLPMKSAEFSAIAQPRKIAVSLMALLVASLGYLTYDMSNNVGKYLTKGEDLKVARQALSQVEDQLNVEIERKQALGIDIKKIQSSLSIHENLQNDGIEPLPMFQVIGQKLGGSLKLDKISMYQVSDNSSDSKSRRSNNVKKDHMFETVMEMSFASDIKPEVGNEVASSFRKRLAEALPVYKVVVSKKAQDLSHQGVLEDTLTIHGVNNNMKEKYTAEIMIKGKIGHE